MSFFFGIYIILIEEDYMKKTLSFEKDLTFQTMIGEITTISFEEDLKFIDKSSVAGNFYVSGKYKMTEASTILEDFSYSIPIEIATIENYDLETTNISVENFTYEIIDDDILRCKIAILLEGREEVVVDEQEEKEEVKIEELVREEPISNKENEVEKKIDILDSEEMSSKEEDILELDELEEKKKTIEKGELDSEEERDCDGEVESEEDLPIKEKSATKEIKETKETEKITETVEKKKIKESVEKIENEEIIENIQPIEKEESVMKENRPTIKVNSLFASLGDESDTFTTYSVYIMRENDSLEKVMDKYKVKKEDLEVYNDLSTIELNSKVIIPTKNNE